MFSIRSHVQCYYLQAVTEAASKLSDDIKDQAQAGVQAAGEAVASIATQHTALVGAAEAAAANDAAQADSLAATVQAASDSLTGEYRMVVPYTRTLQACSVEAWGCTACAPRSSPCLYELST